MIGSTTALAAAFVAGAEAAADFAAGLLTTTHVAKVGLGLGSLSSKGKNHVNWASTTGFDLGIRLFMEWGEGGGRSIEDTYGLLCDDAVRGGHLHRSLLLGFLGSRHFD